MQFQLNGLRNYRNNNNTWLGNIIFTLVGFGVFFWGFNQVQNTRNFLANSQKADGEVIEIISSTSSKGGTMFSPKVSFVDMAGKQITFVPSSSSSSPSYHKGEKVSVLYDPSVPEYAKINSFMDVWFMAMILVSFGLLFFLVGIWGIITKIKNRNLPPDPSENLGNVTINITPPSIKTEEKTEQDINQK